MPDPSLCFATFMQRALYDPKHGYYASGRVRIGKEGDFYTNVSVGPIYGKTLALLFQDLWEKLGKPKPFSIIEQGAHDGRLALDILEALQAEEYEELFACMQYVIVEPFLFHEQRQKDRLKAFKNISWARELAQLPRFIGVHFSNELLDAFPVHILTWSGKEWLEKRVRQEKQCFSWVNTPIKKKKLHAVAATLPTDLSPGFLWEARLNIAPWLDAIAQRMERGMILIADYGYFGEHRFAPYRAEGSIACYHNHRRYNDPLEKPGSRDISAHVDFTALANTAREQDFELLGFSDQHHFMIGALEQWLHRLDGHLQNASTQAYLRQLKTLLHPETMGRQFHFLGLGKAIENRPPLGCFRYERPGIRQLNPHISY